MRDQLRKVISGKRADFLEIRWEEEDITSLALSGLDVDEVAKLQNSVGNVRALVDGVWGFVAFRRGDRLEDCVDQAISIAKHAGKKRRELAPVAPVIATLAAELDGDPRSIDLQTKLELIENYAGLAIGAHPNISNVLSRYQDVFQRRFYLNSEGSDILQEKCYLNASFTLIARHQDVLETYFTGANSVNGYNDLLNQEDKLQQAVDRAAAMAEAPLVQSGTYPVIMDPSMAGLFIHEAFGHLSEGDEIHENEHLRSTMALGTRFASPILSVSDGGSIPGLHGSYAYDDEGTPSTKTRLISNGVLSGRLHNRETAGSMEEAVTGNARAINYQYPPLVRMTNTCIEPGTSSFAEMLRGIPLGLFIRGLKGGTTMKEMFTFAAQEAFMIRNGQVAERVRGAVLTGNVFKTLRSIDAVANDFRWSFSYCGKGGQWMIPVGMGGPSIRIQDVVVGGR